MSIRQICVFAGSSDGAHPDYREAARAVGALLAERDIGIVYGGAGTGLMGAVADAALAAGGRVTGVIPTEIEELAHPGLSELKIVGSMHERKALMASLAAAFLALPGGLGTFEEVLEAATWSQLGLHAKPCGVLNVRGYFDPLLALLDRAVSDGFVSPGHRRIVLAGTAVEGLLGQLADWSPPPSKHAPAGGR